MPRTLGEYCEGRLKVAVGDITEFEGEAIVNAANSGLLGGGGVDGAIHRAAGPSLLEDCKRVRASQYPEGLPAGQAVLTKAGRLPFKAVIHTVGPVWHGGENGEASILAAAYGSSLAIAEGAGLKSLAFPAISTGVYGYPKAEAARIALTTVKAFLASHSLPETVYLVFFSEADARLALGRGTE